MTNNTRFKVDEASYFLSMMKQTFDNDSNNFIYNLNAFLSATRSITLFMQKQYSKKDGFKMWYGKKQNEMENDSDLNFLVKSRNEVIHEKKMNTVMEFTLTPISSGKIVKNPYEKMAFNMDKRAFIENEIDIDIIKYSEIQLNKLIRLVDECERYFLISG